MRLNKQTPEQEWKNILTPQQYRVLRKKDTEPPFSGKYESETREGRYVCAACGSILFDSSTKFDAHCGWPSFYDAKKGAIQFSRDNSFGMTRTEATCANCGGHLGHIFDDAPQWPGGKRYCINSISLDFKPKTRISGTPNKMA